MVQERDSEEDTDVRLEEAAVMLEAMAKELRRQKKKPNKTPQPNKIQLLIRSPVSLSSPGYDVWRASSHTRLAATDLPC
jgi:hypothetical protein